MIYVAVIRPSHRHMPQKNEKREQALIAAGGKMGTDP